MIEIVVALIGAFSIITVALLEKLRRENRQDHGVVQERLSALIDNQKIIRDDVSEVKEDVRHVNSRLDDHIHKTM